MKLKNYTCGCPLVELPEHSGQHGIVVKSECPEHRKPIDFSPYGRATENPNEQEGE